MAPAQVPQIGNVRLLLGTFAGQTNPIPAPSPVVLLDVVLAAGERWSYLPPEGFDAGWLFPYRGSIEVASEWAQGEVAILAEGDGSIEITAETDARVLVGVAVPHPHPLVLGTYSVHTNAGSLASGEQRIREIGERLRVEGRR